MSTATTTLVSPITPHEPSWHRNRQYDDRLAPSIPKSNSAASKRVPYVVVTFNSMADRPPPRRRKSFKSQLRALSIIGRRRRTEDDAPPVPPKDKRTPGSAPPLTTSFSFSSTNPAVSPLSTATMTSSPFSQPRSLMAANFADANPYPSQRRVDVDPHLFAQATSGLDDAPSASSPALFRASTSYGSPVLQNTISADQQHRSASVGGQTWSPHMVPQAIPPSHTASRRTSRSPSPVITPTVTPSVDEGPERTLQVTSSRPQRPGLAPRAWSYQSGPEEITARGRTPGDVMRDNYLFAEASLGLPPEEETQDNDDLPDYAESQRDAAAKARKQALMRGAELERQWAEARSRRRD